MRSKLLHKINDVLEYLQEKVDRRVIVFGVFLLISSFLWLLNSLDNTYSTNLKFPVRYLNLPKDKVLTQDLPTKWSLRVSSYGYNLLQHKLNASPKPLVFDLNKYNLARFPGERSKYYILTNYIQESMLAQLPSGIELMDIDPDSLVFHYAEIVEKKVAVKPMVKYQLARQFMLQKPVFCTPDSITVAGPHTLVDTLQYVYTKSYDFEEIGKSMRRSLSLRDIKNIKFSKSRATVNVPVEQFTESRFKVNILTRNVPDSVKLKLFPTAVDIRFTVGMSQFEHISEKDFLLYVDYNDTKGEKVEKLKIYIQQVSSEIRNLRFFPQNVEFLIEKN